MATEPERDIEKALRAAARHRREHPGAPAEIHPATRRLLQAAVARQKGRGQPGARFWPNLLWGSWPRLAFNFSLLSALLVAAGVWLLPALRTGPSSSARMNLAEYDHAKAKPDSLRLRDDYKAPTPAPSAAPALKKEAQNEPRLAAESDKAAKVDVFNRAAAPNQNKLADLPPTNSADYQKDAAAATPVQPTIPPPAVASSSTVAPALDREFARRQVVSAPAVVSQQFNRVSQPVDAANALQFAEKPPTPGVLNSFRVEQTGRQLRVIDSDGSVYTGFLGETNTIIEDSLAQKKIAGESAQASLAGGQASDQRKENAAGVPVSSAATNSQPAQAPGNAGTVSGKLAESAPAQNAQSGQAYYFRVSGTNLSLNQPVVLTGNFYQDAANTRDFGGGGGGRGGAAPNQLSRNRAGAPAASAVGGAIQSAATNAPVLPLSDLRLQGRALVGTNQVEITALPEKK